ncbi:hypothetical protein LguiB_009323 [Lonicera macranthoides]
MPDHHIRHSLSSQQSPSSHPKLSPSSPPPPHLPFPPPQLDGTEALCALGSVCRGASPATNTLILVSSFMKAYPRDYSKVALQSCTLMTYGKSLMSAVINGRRGDHWRWPRMCKWLSEVTLGDGNAGVVLLREQLDALNERENSYHPWPSMTKHNSYPEINQPIVSNKTISRER